MPSVAANNADVTRLLQEISAAPTRAEAVTIFENADWVFVDMHPRKREATYAKIQDAIAEKPE